MRTQLLHSYQTFRSRGRSHGTQQQEYRIAHSVGSTRCRNLMLESDGQVHASSFRSVAASRRLESIASVEERAQMCTRYEIWGSGVRISSGAPNPAVKSIY